MNGRKVDILCLSQLGIELLLEYIGNTKPVLVQSAFTLKPDRINWIRISLRFYTHTFTWKVGIGTTCYTWVMSTTLWNVHSNIELLALRLSQLGTEINSCLLWLLTSNNNAAFCFILNFVVTNSSWALFILTFF